MIGNGYTISYLNFAILLLMLSGGLILLTDVKGFKLAGLIKEFKVSRFLGWFNIITGIVLIFAKLLI